MTNQSNIKEYLSLLREKLGYGYAPKAVKVLQMEHKRTVDKKDIYHVAHGRLQDDVILQVLCKLAIAKKNNSESTISLLKEAVA